jgi:hypothetical protein
VPSLIQQFRYQLADRPGASEIRSWESSLHTLSADLIQAGLDHVEVLVEYQLPYSSKRADVVLCGVHPRTRQPSFVVVELKQWSAASLLEHSRDLCLVSGAGGVRLHPAEQVRRYCGSLLELLGTLAELDDPVAGVAYLDNATDLAVEELFELPEDELGRLFTGERLVAFAAYLQSRLAVDVGADIADRLLSSAVRPSRQLLALAAQEVQRQEVFRLQDEQQVAYQLVLHALEQSRRGATKQAVVVVGGPGSGKSVIALALLGQLSRILGPDLGWRTDRWIAHPAESHDSAVKRAPLEEYDRAVRNTYKVLLTRGLAGSLVLSTDPETQELLSRLISDADVMPRLAQVNSSE